MRFSLRVLGVDPGTIRLGYGLVESDGDQVRLIDCGTLVAPRRSTLAQRLYTLYQKIGEVLSRFQPDEVAIEEPFLAKNVRSALAIGEARAIVLLAATTLGLPVSQYPPSTIRQTVTDYGGSTKEQVQEMVRLQLGLISLSASFDATDALAVALCHLRQRHLTLILGEDQK